MASVHREAPYITVLLIEHSHSKLNPEPFLKVIPVQVHCALTPASNQVPCSRSLLEWHRWWLVLLTLQLQVLLVEGKDHFTSLSSALGLEELSQMSFPGFRGAVPDVSRAPGGRSHRTILFSPGAAGAQTHHGGKLARVCHKVTGWAWGVLHPSHSGILPWATRIPGYLLNLGKETHSSTKLPWFSSVIFFWKTSIDL